MSRSRIDEQVELNTLDYKTKSVVSFVDNFISKTKAIVEKRRKNFDYYMNFVLDSDQWSYSDLLDFDSDKDVPLVFNFSEEYYEKYLAKLFPRNSQTGVLDVSAKVYENDIVKRKKYLEEIDSVYHENRLPLILQEQGTNFLIGGDACLYYPQDPVTKRANIFSLDPRKCYLGFDGSKLVQFAYRSYDPVAKKHLTIYWDLYKHILIDKNGTVHTEKNNYNFIPFSWIPNNPKPHSHEGRTKIEILSELDAEYNRLSSSFSKRIHDNTEPPLVLKSDRASIKDIERGRSKKSQIGHGDSLDYLELKEGGEIMDWLSTILSRMRSKTGIVDSSGSLSDTKRVSSKTLAYQMSDMLDFIGFMRIRWDEAFRELNNAILNYRYGYDNYSTDPKYNPFTNQTNSERIDDTVKLVENDFMTKEEAIKDLRDLDNAEEVVKNVLKEKELFASVDNPVKK